VINPGQFSPSGEQIYFFVIDNREIYVFDILQKTITDTGIQSDWFRADSQGNIFYIKTGQTTSSTEGNPASLFKFDTKTNMTSVIVKDPSFWSFDVNADGTKILYRKEIESGYGWAQRDLTVYDINTKTHTTIPNIEGEDCGQQPIFAPNDELMIYHIQSCGKGWSGGALGITDINGNSEILTPPANENTDYFVVSPDGISLVDRHDLYVNGTYVVGLSQMVLAKPIPEFGIVSALILAVSLISVVAIGTKFRNL
jgi:predicted secreted protein with PEFG-CTERM motif